MNTCPCNFKNLYSECCETFLSGELFPKTPEELMRSRYTAYVKNNFEYIEQTMKDKPLKEFDKTAAIKNGKEIEWLGLTVINSSKITPDSKIGFVEFMAKYKFHNREYCLHELSEFHKNGARWFYVSGRKPEISRNDICPCGSRKKYKKCCGN